MPDCERSAVERLQALVHNGRAPKYLKLVLDVLVETREVVKDANQRNAELVAKLRLLKEDNFILKQKISALESSRPFDK